MTLKKIKLTDVARRASVDIATASRALNRSAGWERLSEACVQRVEAAAQALDYRPNAAARRLRRPQADAVGILHRPGPTESVWMRELFDGLEAALLEQGLHAVLIAGKPRPPGNRPRRRGTVAAAHEKRPAGRLSRADAPETSPRHPPTHCPRQHRAAAAWETISMSGWPSTPASGRSTRRWARADS